MNRQRLLWNMHCVATVVLRKQLNFKSAVIRSNRSSCLKCGIGGGHDYKAWLICTFTLFTKTFLWYGNYISTTLIDVQKTIRVKN